MSWRCLALASCMKTFCNKDNQLWKENLKLSTNKQSKSHENAKVCYICLERIEGNCTKDKKKYHKIREHFHHTVKNEGVAHSNVI